MKDLRPISYTYFILRTRFPHQLLKLIGPKDQLPPLPSDSLQKLSDCKLELKAKARRQDSEVGNKVLKQLACKERSFQKEKFSLVTPEGRPQFMS